MTGLRARLGFDELLVFRSFSAGFVTPDRSIVGLLTIAVAGALGVVALAMPLVDSLTGTQVTRFE